MKVTPSGGDAAAGADPNGAGADSQSADERTELDAQSSGDAGNGAGPDDGDDEDDDDDYSDVPFNEHPRFKQLTRKLAKTRRQLSKVRPVAERVRDMNVDELLTKARTSDQLQELLARNPKLRAKFVEAMNGAPDDTQPGADDDEFDPSKLPFDVNDESGKFFANFYKEFRELRKENRALRGQVEGVTRETEAQRNATETRSWKSAVDAAKAKLPAHFQDMFHDAVYGAFREARTRGVRVNPQQVIDHYLSKAGVNKSTQVKASDAARERIAQKNQTLPRQPQNPGAPASARGDKRETVGDVNRRLKASWAR